MVTKRSAALQCQITDALGVVPILYQPASRLGCKQLYEHSLLGSLSPGVGVLRKGTSLLHQLGQSHRSAVVVARILPEHK